MSIAVCERNKVGASRMRAPEPCRNGAVGGVVRRPQEGHADREHVRGQRRTLAGVGGRQGSWLCGWPAPRFARPPGLKARGRPAAARPRPGGGSRRAAPVLGAWPARTGCWACPARTVGHRGAGAGRRADAPGRRADARASTFDRRDVRRGLCQHIPQGACVAGVERLADRLLTIPEPA